MTSSRNRFAAVVSMALLTTMSVCARGAEELHDAYAKRSDRYARELAEFADGLTGPQTAGLAERVRHWRPAAWQPGTVLFAAPDQYVVDAPSAPDIEPAGDAWSEQFHELRAGYADDLFELAQRAADAGEHSLAYRWATEVVRENPDHQEARRVLGYVERDGVWLTPLGERLAEQGKEWHPRFGWIRSDDRARWEAGERLVGRRWMSAESDAARHAELEDGWKIRTDHFLVTTNHSIEAGVELAARLERLYQLWRQLFAGFYQSDRDLREQFAEGLLVRGRRRPFRVYYHRSRDEYTNALLRRQPRIDQTLGIYFDKDRESHFFAGDEQDAGTLYHEAVHQLFQETAPATRNIGDDANFWIVEGVATYFESLAAHNDAHAGVYYTIGEPTAGRLPAARQRLLQDRFYVPFAQLVQLGKDDLQRHPEIAKVYSQSAGMANFLMQYEHGRYRQPLVRYLRVVYSGRDEPDTLATLTDQPFDELDAQYAEHLQSLP